MKEEILPEKNETQQIELCIFVEIFEMMKKFVFFLWKNKTIAQKKIYKKLSLCYFIFSTLLINSFSALLFASSSSSSLSEDNQHLYGIKKIVQCNSMQWRKWKTIKDEKKISPNSQTLHEDEISSFLFFLFVIFMLHLAKKQLLVESRLHWIMRKIPCFSFSISQWR